MKKFVLLLVSCAMALVSAGQSPIWKKMKVQYPEDLAVFTQRDKTVTIEVQGDSLSMTADIRESLLFLKDQPEGASEIRVYGSHFREVSDLGLTTQVWEKNKYRDLKVPNLPKQREENSSVFYDDSYFYVLNFPAALAGNIAQWQYKETYRDPRFLPSFYFSDYRPQTKGVYLVKTSRDVELGWLVMNNENNLIRFKQYTKGDFNYYEWSAENIKTVRNESSIPSGAYILPHVVVYVKSYKGTTGRHGVLRSIDDLYAGYVKTISGLQPPSDENLKAEIAKMNLDGLPELEKVRRIFYWVQRNIRYIAFEDGMRGLIPHPADYVYQKRYGDCKDMASLTVGMLHLAGVKSYYTWIGTRDIPYRYTQLPSPLVDNHMIATYIAPDSTYYFLDATSNYISGSLPSSMIQEKEALVAISPEQYKIKTVPRIEASMNAKVDSVHLTIESNVLMGSGVSRFRGYQKVDCSYAVDKSREDAVRDNVVSWVRKGSNKFFLDSYKLENLHDNDAPLTINYDFRISDYLSQAGNELFLNLNLEKVFYNFYIPETRNVPYECDYAFENSVVYVLNVPDDYSVEYLPPDTTYNSDLISYSIKYSQEGNKVLLRTRVARHALMITKDQFPQWNAIVKDLSANLKESLVLKKKV